MHDVRRIAVVGRAGAGKTTVANRLGASLELPIVHLDRLFWTTDWTEVPRATFEAAQQEAVDGDRWVIDGGYLSSAGWSTRLARADLIVVVEAPLPVCLWRVIRRSMARRDVRPDRPSGAREQFSPYFVWWVVTWGRRYPHLASSITAAVGTDRVVVVRRQEDVETIIRRQATRGR